MLFDSWENQQNVKANSMCTYIDNKDLLASDCWMGYKMNVLQAKNISSAFTFCTEKFTFCTEIVSLPDAIL